jgi:hypothetical protein
MDDQSSTSKGRASEAQETAISRSINLRLDQIGQEARSTSVTFIEVGFLTVELAKVERISDRYRGSMTPSEAMKIESRCNELLSLLRELTDFRKPRPDISVDKRPLEPGKTAGSEGNSQHRNRRHRRRHL